jgi:hypothetical protein
MAGVGDHRYVISAWRNLAVATTLRCQLSMARRLLRSGEIRRTALVHLQLSSRGRQCATAERIVSTAL